ncbi:MAG: PKD domain-containing protein [Bacteroidota bacterium]
MKKYIFFFIFFLINIYAFAQTFKPNQVTGLVLWLRADSNVTYASTVSAWNDCSVYGNNAIQSTAANQPLYVANALNGKPLLRFDGVNDLFNINAITLTKVSFFCVMKVIGAANRVIILGTTSASTYNSIQNMSGSINSYIQGGTGTSQVSASTGHILDYAILSGVWNGSNSTFYVNSTPYVGTSNTFTAIYNTIGARTNSLPAWSSGDIAEIIVYNNDISTLNRANVEQYLRLKYAKQINLGADINIPYGFKPTSLNAHSGFTNYLWKGGTTDSILNISKTGTYWVQANDIFGYVSKDTIKVTYPNTKLNYQNDTAICSGTSGSNLFLKSVITKKNKYAFLWSNGATDSVINVSTTGNYWVKITDTLGYYSYSDTIHIGMDNFAQSVNLGNDTSFCSGNYIRIQPPLPNPLLLNYTWSDGSHDTTLVVTATGNYKVTVTNQAGCTGKDSVNITINGSAPNTLFKADTVCLGSAMQFTDLSSVGFPFTIVKWHWKFTTTDTSNLQNPVFTFATAGLHNVKLTAYTAGGCSQSFSLNVLVYPLPIPSFAVDAACRNNPYQFVDQSSIVSGDAITAWDWNFGDATPHSNVQNPLHTYAHGNDYTVTLSLQTQNGCHNSVFHLVHVDSVATLPLVPTLIFPANNAMLSDTAITFSWSSALNSARYKLVIATDPIFSNIIENAYIDTTYFTKLLSSANQNYYWRVYAYNICNDSSIALSNTFGIFSPIALGGLSLWLKADEGITLNSGHVSVWADQSGNGNTATQSTLANQPLYVANGLNGKPLLRFDGVNDLFNINAITLTKVSFFCVMRVIGVTNRVIILGTTSTSTYNAIQNMSGTTNSFIQGGNGSSQVSAATGHILNYAILSGVWDGSASTFYVNLTSYIGTSSTFTAVYNTIGARTNSLPAWSSGDIAEIIVFDTNISNTNRVQVENYLNYKYAGPPVNLGPDITIAYGMCGTSLDAGSRFTHYHWSTGDTTQTINITQSGQYSVTATNVFGILSSDTVNITLPSITVHDTAFCLGSPIVLHGNMGSVYNYLWQPGNVASPNFTISQAGTYSLTVYDTLGCHRTKTFSVTADSFAVIASLGPDKKICKGDYIGLVSGAQQAVSYLWSDASGNSLLTINDAFGTHPTYSVTVSSANGCMARDTITLNVNGVKPIAAFVSDSVCFGLPTSFTNLSSVVSPFNLVSRAWNFGDSSTATVTNPQHLYTAAGYYPVSLTVTTDSGCIATIQKTTKVFSIPTVNFLPYQGCNAVPIAFLDKTLCPFGTLTHWQWKFNDTYGAGYDTSTMKNPTYTFDSVGTYAVKLISVSQGGCTDSVISNVLIKKSPRVDFSATDACAGNLVYFNDITPLEPWETVNYRQWDFGDGGTASVSNPSHIFSAAGSYTVSLTLKTSSGCEITRTKALEIGGKAVSNFTFANNCENNITQFTDISTVSPGSITAWHWNFDGMATSSQQNPGFVFADTGTFHVSLWVNTDHNCPDSISLPVAVLPAPHANFTLNPEYGIPPLAVNFANLSSAADSYIWAFGDGILSSVSNPVHTYTTQGTFIVLLTAYNANGCSDTLSHNVYVFPTTVDIDLMQAYVQTVNNRLLVSADLMNIGTRKIDSIDMSFVMENGSVIHEQWHGELFEGESLPFVFTSSPELPTATDVNYICVRASLPGLQEDSVANNRKCVVLKNDFFALEPYPNPFTNTFTLAYILPFSDKVVIEIYDVMGNAIGELYNGMGAEGYNSLQLDMSTLIEGVYTYKISFRDKVLHKKIVKM